MTNQRCTIGGVTFAMVEDEAAIVALRKFRQERWRMARPLFKALRHLRDELAHQERCGDNIWGQNSEYHPIAHAIHEIEVFLADYNDLVDLEEPEYTSKAYREAVSKLFVAIS